ncbi:MAG: hypothetical protein ACTS85_04425 [Arsenophonus sp. NC-PG7-MAG3]
MGETGRKLAIRLGEHPREEGNRITNSLYARHFVETGHRFINFLECFQILKRENNLQKDEELEILKINRKIVTH